MFDIERGPKSVDKNKIINSILRYIESDPENYTQTEEHNVALKGVEEEIAPFFEEENINKIFGSDLNALSGTARATIVKKLERQLRTSEIDFFGELFMTGDRKEADFEGKKTGKIFKNLTRDQQEDIIHNKINEYVASVTEKYRSAYRSKEHKD